MTGLLSKAKGFVAAAKCGSVLCGILLRKAHQLLPLLDHFAPPALDLLHRAVGRGGQTKNRLHRLQDDQHLAARYDLPGFGEDLVTCPGIGATRRPVESGASSAAETGSGHAQAPGSAVRRTVRLTGAHDAGVLLHTIDVDGELPVECGATALATTDRSPAVKRHASPARRSRTGCSDFSATNGSTRSAPCSATSRRCACHGDQGSPDDAARCTAVPLLRSATPSAAAARTAAAARAAGRAACPHGAR